MIKEPMQPTSNNNIPFICTVIAMAIFGSVGFVAGMTGLKSFELVFVRCICATLFLGVGWVISGQCFREQWKLRELFLVLLSGIILVFNWIFLFRAFEAMPVTIAISIYYLAPVIVLLLGSLLYRERLTFLSVGSISVCVVGTALVSGIGPDSSFSQLLSEGIIWAFLAAFFYALLTLLAKGIKSMSPYAVAMLQTLIGILILPPFVNFEAYAELGPNNWIAVAVIGSIHTGLVYYLFFGSVRHLPARLISALVFLDPGVAIILDMLITGFRPSILQTIGIILTFAGISLTLIRTKNKIKEYSRQEVLDEEAP